MACSNPDDIRSYCSRRCSAMDRHSSIRSPIFAHGGSPNRSIHRLNGADWRVHRSNRKSGCCRMNAAVLGYRTNHSSFSANTSPANSSEATTVNSAVRRTSMLFILPSVLSVHLCAMRVAGGISVYDSSRGSCTWDRSRAYPTFEDATDGRTARRYRWSARLVSPGLW